MYVAFKFFIVFVCFRVCLSGWGGVLASHGSAGGLGPGVRGSTLFLGAGGRNYSHPLFINSAAPAPVRVRQRCPCPSTYSPSSHSPSSSFSFSLGRGRASPPLAPPRLTSDALGRLHLLPPFPPPCRSRLLPARLPRLAPTGGSAAGPDPAARPPGTPAASQGAMHPLLKPPGLSAGLWLPLLRAVGLLLRKVAFLCRGT